MRTLPWEYGIRNLVRAPLRTALSVGGAGLVVILVISAAAFVRGMEQSLKTGGDPHNVILLGAGSEESVERSEVTPSAATIAAASISGLRTRLGTPYVSPEAYMATVLQAARDDGKPLLGALRGIEPTAFLVHSKVRITDGHAPGPDEMLVGKSVHVRLGLPKERLATGQTLWFDNQKWRICGHFEAPGTTLEAEIWMQLSDLKTASKREMISCIVLTLDPDEGEFADVDLFCKQRLDLELVALRETDYYKGLYMFYRPVQAMIWITAILIALGGLFGGLNTMYAAFAARVRELSALQALGYTRLAIVLSLLQESLLASIAGSLIATAFAFVLLEGVSVRFTMGVFGLVLDAPVIALGLSAGLGLGAIGAVPPAWRCLRMPITEGLKAA